MELISWTIYDLKVYHKIFIMLVVVEKENLPPQLQRKFLCMSFANKFTTHTCYSWMQWFSPIHHPNQLGDTEADAAALGTGATERSGSRLHTLPLLYLLSDIYTMFYKGVSWGELLRCIMPRFRCHTELHYTELTVGCLRYSSDMSQYISLLFFSNKALDSTHISYFSLWFCRRVSVNGVSARSVSWWGVGGYIRQILTENLQISWHICVIRRQYDSPF